MSRSLHTVPDQQQLAEEDIPTKKILSPLEADTISQDSLNEFGDFDPLASTSLLKQTERKVEKNNKTNAAFKDAADLADRMFDSIYLALSMLDWGTHCADSTSEAAGSQDYKNLLHDHWDIAITAVFFMLFLGAFASNMAKKKKAQLLWPYFRDILSGLKNGRHAFMNLFFIAQAFGQASAYNMFNPIGIAVGCALAPALIAYRKLDSKRTDMICYNEGLIQSLEVAFDDDAIKYHDIIPKRRHAALDATMMVLAGFNGVTDGSYLFGCITLVIGFGVINGLTMGTPLMVVTALLTAYAIASTICKIHEEYLKQRQLARSADEVDIAKLKHQLNILEKKAKANDNNLKVQIKELKSEINIATQKFCAKYHIEPGQLQEAYRLKRRFKDFKERFEDFATSSAIVKVGHKELDEYNTLNQSLIEAEIAYITNYKYRPKSENIELLQQKIKATQVKILKAHEPLTKHLLNKRIKILKEELDALQDTVQKEELHRNLHAKITATLNTETRKKFYTLHNSYNKIRQDQAVHLTSYTPKTNLNGYAKAIWYMWRGILTAVKNIKKVGDSVNGFIDKLAILVIKYVIKVPMIIYAKYYLDKEKKKHWPKKTQPYQVSFFKSAPVLRTVRPADARPLTPR